MIRVICPNCESKLNAKDELAGQTRKCPKCGTQVLIAPEDASAATLPSEAPDASPTPADPQAAGGTSLKALDAPERLGRANYYVICDRAKVAAVWESNGQGWMLKTSSGLINAARNHALLPAQGDFRLVELEIHPTDEGHRLVHLTTYQLAQRWALTKLERGDHQILSSVTGYGSLNKAQKSAVRMAIKDRFMPEIWQGARNVLDYLANTDYHSPGTT